MKLLKTNNNFYKELENFLFKRSEFDNENIKDSVKLIIDEVKTNGDNALFNYTREFDGLNLTKKDLLLNESVRNSYKANINNKIFLSFKKSIENVRKFHELQLPKNYKVNNEGIQIESQWKPLESVGLYIPGGKSVYPSSLIMNVIPAQVAGVKRIVCVTPPTESFNPYILGLLNELKIKEVYQVGGAQAIAALAHGTETIKPVNKIFGPGNDYVTSAKKQLYGMVGIDLIAGPSEIVVVANKNNNPKWVACDLMAQAEHDINAQSILITDSISFADDVQSEIKVLINSLPRKEIIKKSLDLNGLIVLVEDILESPSIINYIAPEHLHIQIEARDKIVKNINNSGCIFLGEYTSEAFGDYIVGTNHILPTFGSSKFSSGLGVLDFMKRNSIVEINQSAYSKLHTDVEQMAEVEKFDAHKLSVKIRQS